jgi:hypothetical protein
MKETNVDTMQETDVLTEVTGELGELWSPGACRLKSINTTGCMVSRKWASQVSCGPGLCVKKHSGW